MTANDIAAWREKWLSEWQYSTGELQLLAESLMRVEPHVADEAMRKLFSARESTMRLSVSAITGAIHHMVNADATTDRTIADIGNAAPDDFRRLVARCCRALCHARTNHQAVRAFTAFVDAAGNNLSATNRQAYMAEIERLAALPENGAYGKGNLMEDGI